MINSHSFYNEARSAVPKLLAGGGEASQCKLIYGVNRFNHISDIMRDELHWLRAGKCIDFKLCLLVYKAVHGLAPDYIAETCLPVGSVESRQRLHSSTTGNLIIPATNTQFGQRVFFCCCC